MDLLSDLPIPKDKSQVLRSLDSVQQLLQTANVVQKIESIKQLLPDNEIVKKVGTIQQKLASVDKKGLSTIINLVVELNGANGDIPKMIGILVMSAINNPEFIEMIKNTNIISELVQNAEQLQTLLKK
jgi:hypothetical protein